MTYRPRRTAAPRLGGLLLAPGAGADSSQAGLVAVADGLAPLPVRRMDFPYRLAGRKIPDRAPELIDAVRRVAADFAAELRVDPAAIAIGGRSMGGRICSMAAAAGQPAAALVLLSYPLHPPGRPERLRTEHFAALSLPCLFVCGTRDPFGSPAEFEAACTAIPGPVTTVWLEGQGHSPRGRDRLIVAAVHDFLAGVPSAGPRRPPAAGHPVP